MVCSVWYDVGGVGSSENDQKGRTLENSFGAVRLDSAVHHPCRQYGHFGREEVCIGLLQKDADS